VGGFAGVPVFQAEGLTVKTDRARYTPLFLAREDLDAAVGNAYNQRGGEREAGASAGVAAATEEDQRAQQAVPAPARGPGGGSFLHLTHVKTVRVVLEHVPGWLRPGQRTQNVQHGSSLQLGLLPAVVGEEPVHVARVAHHRQAYSGAQLEVCGGIIAVTWQHRMRPCEALKQQAA